MIKLNRTARFFYASAFFIPFFWAAAGNTLPLFEPKQEHNNTVVHAAPTTTQFASLEKEAPSPPFPDEFHLDGSGESDTSSTGGL